MSEDTEAKFKADLLRDDPDAVYRAGDAKALEFLKAAVKFAKSMAVSDDPWLGIRCLTEAVIWLKDAQARIDKELASQRKPKSTSEAFRR